MSDPATQHEDEPVLEAYFDEAGNTGDNLGDRDQPNLMFACVVIPRALDAAF
jgi:hypothetical protein